MPIKDRGNNRVLPANARSVDVARETIHRILPNQNRRAHAAFQVQGWNGVLYHRKETGGLQCACTHKSGFVQTRLDGAGKLNIGAINELISGGQEFGIVPYGTTTADQPDYVNEQDRWTPNINPNPVLKGNSQVPREPSMYQTGDPSLYQISGSAFDVFASEGNNANAGTIVPSEDNPTVGSNHVVEENNSLVDLFDNDFSLTPFSDINCPICFGTKIVGGWTIENGFRQVLVPFDSNVVPSADFTLDLEDKIPVALLYSGSISWSTVLPMGVTSVDSLRAWNGRKLTTPSSVLVDGMQIRSAQDLIRFCNGLKHTVTLNYPVSSEFIPRVSHLEIQLNQSYENTLFDLPKTTKSSMRSLLDSTSPFQVLFSPKVSALKNLDVIIESSLRRVLQISDCTPWHTSEGQVLGWEANVRVCQPQELLYLLPARAERRQLTRVPGVVDNGFGAHRT